MKQELKARGIRKVDGILFDLGVSSYQFDNGDRGFSYNHDAVLDMRMDKRQEFNAYTLVNTWSEKDIVEILFKYGEEKFSSSIAKKIVEEREKRPFLSIEEVQYRAKVSGTLIEKMKSMGIFEGMSESNQLSLFD